MNYKLNNAYLRFSIRFDIYKKIIKKKFFGVFGFR